MVTIRIGTEDINSQIAQEDKELVSDVVERIIRFSIEKGEGREEFYDHDCGGTTYLEDTNIPLGFRYAQVALEAYKALRELWERNELRDRQSAEAFLIGFIISRRNCK